LVVVHNEHLVAAIEFKAQHKSFGNNYNNRTEEALGTAVDLWRAYKENLFGKDQAAPWLGWAMLLADTKKSTTPVGIRSPHFDHLPEFDGKSYAQRYGILMHKMLREKLYDGAALLLSSKQDGETGAYTEPDEALTFKKFLAGLAGHVGGYVASL
jgi:type II restriction enzyme